MNIAFQGSFTIKIDDAELIQLISKLNSGSPIRTSNSTPKPKSNEVPEKKKGDMQKNMDLAWAFHTEKKLKLKEIAKEMKKTPSTISTYLSKKRIQLEQTKEIVANKDPSVPTQKIPSDSEPKKEEKEFDPELGKFNRKKNICFICHNPVRLDEIYLDKQKNIRCKNCKDLAPFQIEAMKNSATNENIRGVSHE